MSVWKLKPRTKSSQTLGPTIEELSTNALRQNLECLKKRQAELNAPPFEPYQQSQEIPMRPMEDRGMTMQSVRAAVRQKAREVTQEEVANSIQNLWQDGDQEETIQEINGIQLTRHDFGTLKDQMWLNDKVIDAYMELIMQRSQRRSLPKVYAFSTYFYPALKTKGYSGVSRWTSNVDIFTYDILLVPVHSNSHWSLIAFDKKRNFFAYLDSMAYSDGELFNSIATNYVQEFASYFAKESMEKRQILYHKRTAKIVNFNGLPTQGNAHDCGVFVCSYAESITRGKFRKFSFEQSDIKSFRRKICFELGDGRILDKRV